VVISSDDQGRRSPLPPITIDSTSIEVMIEDNEGVFCETEDRRFRDR